MKKLLLLLSLMLSAITTWATPQGYAELAVNNGKAWGASDARYTLTFRYGEMPSNTATAHYYDAENTPRITNMTDYHDVEDWQVFGDIWFQRTPDTVNAGKHLPLYYITHAVFEPSFANARPKSTAFWFFTGNCDLWTAQVSELISIEGLEYLNTSEVTHMEMMFGGCNRLTSIDVSHFDTSKVTDMTNMFIGCQVCRSLDVSNWDTSNVTTMSAMFFACQRLASVDVSNWDVSNVEDMYAMFNECRKLESIDVSNWNTSKVEDMHGIFSNCQSLTSLDVSNLDLSGITNNSSCITWYNLPALQTLTVGDVSECAFWLGRGKSFPGLQNLTFTDATSFLANRAIAETFLNNLKTASPNVQIVLDCELTPAQLAFFQEILGEENVVQPEGRGVVTSVSVKIGSLGKTTLYSPYDLDFTDSPVKAYIATAFIPDGISGTLTATRIKQVPANTGVLLVGAQGTYTIPTSMSTIIISNMFRGTVDAITDNGLPQQETVNGVKSTNYYFASDGAFYSVASTGRNLGAGKAYLTLPSYMLPASATTASAPIRIVFDDMSEEATAIDAPLNGKMTGENVYYNLNGQRVEKLSKGIYVKNGKKVFVK